ncbi:uncharacterized protein LOC123527164 [Mercenaria mercenaria]|uniref:uncharacterized protein LOC123527164 n=1 Tax=Mercenaria mercenaria TaxID=6596 RepID=UPI00234F6B42|nr:uncharacterized protein LOC123527164 [Mercenaria mercenaria]
MLGDFNAGPRARFINPFEQPSYDVLASVFTTMLVREPTYSADNPYNGGTSAPDVAVDHVFGSRNVKILNAEVVLKEDHISVGEQRLPLSDHYGVEAFIKVCRTRRRYTKYQNRRVTILYI